MRSLAAALILTATSASTQSASVSGTDGTNALGYVPCAAIAGQPVQNCHAELRRKEDGTATLAVQLPTGTVRRIYFDGGNAASTDATAKMSTETRGNTLVIFIEPNEVFEIPADAVAAQ